MDKRTELDDFGFIQERMERIRKEEDAARGIAQGEMLVGRHILAGRAMFYDADFLIAPSPVNPQHFAYKPNSARAVRFIEEQFGPPKGENAWAGWHCQFTWDANWLAKVVRGRFSHILDNTWTAEHVDAPE